MRDRGIYWNLVNKQTRGHDGGMYGSLDSLMTMDGTDLDDVLDISSLSDDNVDEDSNLGGKASLSTSDIL